jgi:hypothetical protein
MGKEEGSLLKILRQILYFWIVAPATVEEILLRPSALVSGLRFIGRNFKGTVSPNVGLHFRFWKIKLVLSSRLLMVLTFFFFVVPEIFKFKN